MENTKNQQVMKKSIKLNSNQALDIISALSIRADNLEEDINESFFPVCESDKDELKRLKSTITALDSTFWTKDGELK